MMRSSFCVVLCGEVVNVRLRNISNSYEPQEKRYTGAICALRPHIFVLTLVTHTINTEIKDSNFIGAGHNFCSVGRLPLE
jgi:hypothetical protein